MNIKYLIAFLGICALTQTQTTVYKEITFTLPANLDTIAENASVLITHPAVLYPAAGIAALYATPIAVKAALCGTNKVFRATSYVTAETARLLGMRSLARFIQDYQRELNCVLEDNNGAVAIPTIIIAYCALLAGAFYLAESSIQQ